MATIESYEMLKGTVQGDLTFHFDVSNDVLYLRLASMQGQEVFGEEMPDGFLLFRTDRDEVAGLTVLDYWKRFGAACSCRWKPARQTGRKSWRLRLDRSRG